MNKPIVAAVATLAIAIAAGSGFWLGQQRASVGAGSALVNTASGKAPPTAGAVVVEAAKPLLATLPQTLTAVGSLRSDESVTLRPEVAGRINSIQFQEGQRVTKGAMLVRLDPAINDAEVQQARANMTLAKSKFDRAVDLAKSNFISGQAKDEAENNLKVAEAALALAAARQAKMDIRAPFAGIIGLRSVSVGDYVKEGADMVNLEAIDPLKVDFRVPEMYMQQVTVGQPLSIALDALPGKTFEGRVTAVNPLLDAAGRSVVIRAQVRNADTSLRPGMFARVRLVTKVPQESLMVPEQALVPQGNEQYVFKVVDGKAVRGKVEIGQRRDGKAEIVAGIGANDVIVTAGQLKLRDGMSVQMAPGTASAAITTAPEGMAPLPVPAKAENVVPAAPKS